MAANRSARIVVPHDETLEYHEVNYLPGYRGTPAYVMRDAIGRRREGALYRWLPLICNEPDCPFVGLLSADQIRETFERALR